MKVFHIFYKMSYNISKYLKYFEQINFWLLNYLINLNFLSKRFLLCISVNSYISEIFGGFYSF